ncbi:unnamed protein product [Blepharisma stoltei]|uniref:CCT domain-containing protein n=1 Tax=Blepharisma stoltei TaxID=1481888 RepID=A0AAU9K0G6_9CILI|nr:unnamed protein product [Blepharisma stoltei]
MSGPDLPIPFQSFDTHEREGFSMFLPQFNQFITQSFDGNLESINLPNTEIKGEGNRLPEFFGFYENILRMSMESCLMNPNPEFWMNFQNPESSFSSEGIDLPAEIKGCLNATQYEEKPKQIGLISAEERRLKIQRYLEKRKRRTFRKIVTYECRKKVADSRIRVKGRFITKEQAEMLKNIHCEKAVEAD